MLHDCWAGDCRRLTRASSIDAEFDCTIGLFVPPLAVHRRLRLSGLKGCNLDEPKSSESTVGAEMMSAPSENTGSAAKQAGSSLDERTQDPAIPGGTVTDASP